MMAFPIPPTRYPRLAKSARERARPRAGDEKRADPGSIEAYGKLALAARDRWGDPGEAIRWAARYALIPLEKIDQNEVPCAVAVSLLRIAKADLNGFLQRIWLKLVLSERSRRGWR